MGNTPGALLVATFWDSSAQISAVLFFGILEYRQLLLSLSQPYRDFNIVTINRVACTIDLAVVQWSDWRHERRRGYQSGAAPAARCLYPLPLTFMEIFIFTFKTICRGCGTKIKSSVWIWTSAWIAVLLSKMFYHLNCRWFVGELLVICF